MVCCVCRNNTATYLTVLRNFGHCVASAAAVLDILLRYSVCTYVLRTYACVCSHGHRCIRVSVSAAATQRVHFFVMTQVWMFLGGFYILRGDFKAQLMPDYLGSRAIDIRKVGRWKTLLLHVHVAEEMAAQFLTSREPILLLTCHRKIYGSSYTYISLRMFVIACADKEWKNECSAMYVNWATT